MMKETFTLPNNMKEPPGSAGEKRFSQESLDKAVLLEIASTFLVGDTLEANTAELDDLITVNAIQEGFQENLAHYYHESGLSKKVSALRLQEAHHEGLPLDKQALNLMTQESQGVHGWIDMLPQLRKGHEDVGMNCTLTSAMLHHALEELDYTGVRTVIRNGHSVVLREHDDGSVEIYDSASASTVNGQLAGYSRKFTPEQLVDRHGVEEGGGREGYSFTLATNARDELGGFLEMAEDGSDEYVQHFYAYDPAIKMDIAVALGNLSEIKDDEKEFVSQIGNEPEGEIRERLEQASGLCEKFPELRAFDFKTTKSKFDIFDGHDYLGADK
jgi:hypothetical protein